MPVQRMGRGTGSGIAAGRHLGLALVLVGLSVGAAPSSDRVFPPGHPAEGLPIDGRPFPAFSADGTGPLDEIVSLLFQAELVPVEVGAALPAERAAGDETDEAFYQRGWYFRKRAGVASDRAVFGGDVRISPLVALSNDQSARLVTLLDRLATPEQVNAFPELRPPLARLLLQWDLWNAWWRLEQAKNKKGTQGDPEPKVLEALARAVVACAQPEAALRALPDGVVGLRRTFDGGKPGNPRSPYIPQSLLTGAPDSPWVEIDRSSSKLFHGAATFRAARVFINAGTAEQGRKLVEASAQARAGRLPEVELGTEAALVLSLVGLTPELVPIATPVVDEVRIRALVGPPALAPAEGTTSRDGLNQWLFLRTRWGSLHDPERGAFRFVPDSAQGLFLEYGTAKRTTYFAQCTLCHRTTNDGGQAPSGLRSLSRTARPRVVDQPETRLWLAETEVGPSVLRLKARLGLSAP